MSQSQNNQDIAHVYNSHSSDSGANKRKSEVELTGFVTLGDDFEIGDSLYSEKNIRKTQSLNDEKDEPSNIEADSLPDSGDIIRKQTSTVVGQEDFIVIWRQLSFKVDISLYDRVANFFDRGSKETYQSRESKQQQQQQQQQQQRQQHANFSGINSTDDLVEFSIESRKLENFYEMNEVDTKRIIFENLNGFIKSGQISAILGPSGAGKTSLLNAICGRTDNYRGKVQLIGGGSRNLRLSIIPQKDYLFENLTVRETLLYSSQILNTNKEFDHETHILNIVNMLNLADCFESSVSNISGGEYKRVSIAQELLKQPDLLILDEPTSGLDSLNCKNLIKSLAQLIEASRRGDINPIAIVMTIHQPDIEVFHMFDHVYCMARGGRVIYDGHPNNVMEVLSSQLKGSSKYDAAIDGQSFAINPATLLIEIASENIYGQQVIEKLAEYQRTKFELEMCGANNASKLSSEQLHERIITKLDPEKNGASDEGSRRQNSNMMNKFESSNTLSISISPSLSDIATNEKQTKHQHSEGQLVRDKRLNVKKDSQGKFWYHTNILAQRAFKSTIRDSLSTVISFLFHLTIPFVMWMVYSKEIGSSKACPVIQRNLDLVSMISNKTIERIVSLNEELNLSLECTIMLFLTIYAYSMCSIAVVALAFPLNMHILLKEVRNGWYSLTSFVVAKTIANFPFEVLFPIMSFMLAYILLGMPPSYLQWRFWAMALVMAFVSLISHTHGLVFGAIFMDNVEASIFLSTSMTLPFVLLSGFTSRMKNMPTLLQHLSWLSLYKHSVSALNIIRFGYGICPCDDAIVDYLKTEKPNLSDIPQNMKSLFAYYLTSSSQDITMTTTDSTFGPIIYPTDEENITNSTLAGASLVPSAIGSELTISQIERKHLLSMIDTGQVEPFQNLANLVTKSFTFGRELTTCENVRSEILIFFGTPVDEHLPYLFLGMILLLTMYKILLFVVVKYRIGNRI